MLKNSKVWNNIKEIISVLQSIIIILGFSIGIWQISIIQKQVEIQSKALSDSNKIASVNYVLELSKRMDSPKYDKIMKAIAYNSKNYPILKKSGGHFREEEVDDLIGLYETVGNLYQENLISFKMAYNEFSDDFEAAYCNKDIQRHIIKIRKEDRSVGAEPYFVAFEALTKEFLNFEKTKCEKQD